MFILHYVIMCNFFYITKYFSKSNNFPSWIDFKKLLKPVMVHLNYTLARGMGCKKILFGGWCVLRW